MPCPDIPLGWETIICVVPIDRVSLVNLVTPYQITFFLQVHLCEVENPQDLVSLDFPLSVRKEHPLLVAVKILRPDATKNAR